MPFLMNAWYAAFWTQDLPPGKLLARKLLGKNVLFFRGRDGGCVATSGRCPHRFAPLEMGQLMPSGAIRCAYHGLEFGPDGRCAHNPHGPIPGSLRLGTYEVRERHSVIWIWMGTKPADEARIPDLSMMNDAADGLFRDRDTLQVDGNYLLLVDNLLDLTHANYLHEGYLGYPEHSKARIVVEQRGDEILSRRTMSNIPVAPMHDLMFKRDGRPIDMLNESHWMPPSSMVLRHSLLSPGGAPEERCDFQAAHLLTPETESTTHYLFGIAMKPSSLDEGQRKRLTDMRRHVFEYQDKAMIEGQQAMLGGQEFLSAQPALLSIDAASVRMRRVLQRLIDIEASPDSPE